MLDLLFLAGGLVLTILAANWLVDGAASIAKRFNVSDLVIGLTIVALGTSTPELAINIFSAIEGSTGLAIGNVLGSNIANILLILGAAAVISPLTITKNTTWKEIPFSLLAVLVFGLMANDVLLDPQTSESYISRNDGLVMLSFLAIFLVYTFDIAKSGDNSETEGLEKISLGMSIFLIVVGIAGLFVGGKFMVDGAIGLAQWMGVSERVIGLTIVAIGTSLPELAAAVAASRKGKTDLAVGNVIGSNIFNIFLILGVTASIKPLPFSGGPLNHDILLTLAATLVLFAATFIYTPRRIDKREGWVFLGLYFIYLVSLVVIR